MELLLGNGAKASVGGPAAGDLIKDSDTARFVHDVLDASMEVPVIVDFWATWCEPCKTLGPLLEKHVLAAKGAVRMVKIDVDKNQDLAAQMRIQSVPSVYAFDKGQPVDGFTGAQSESQIKAFIDRLTAGRDGNGIEEALTEARLLLTEGDAVAAQQIYQQVLVEDKANAAAFGGFLRCLMALGEHDKAKAMLARLPAEIAKHADVVAVQTALDLLEQAEKAGPADALHAAVAANPDDYQARFDLAMSCFAQDLRQEAIDCLLEIIRRDRAWNDDGARKQLLKLLEAIGFSDPLSVATRKRLSTLLFS